MTRSVILSAVRTPFGRLGRRPGAPLGDRPRGVAIRAALERAGVEPAEVEYVVMGQVLQAGAGQAPARQAAVAAGIPVHVPSETVNKVCASGLRAVAIADQMIRAGDHEVVVAGGMESMSNAPYALARARFGYRIGGGELIDLIVHDGLTSSFDGRHMVEQASFVSRELEISREDQDLWALRSHRRAVAAIDAGLFRDETVAVNGARGTTSTRAATPRSSSSPPWSPSWTPRARPRPATPPASTTARRRSSWRARRSRAAAACRCWRRSWRRPRWPTTTPTSRARRRWPVRWRWSAPGWAIDDVARVEINEAFASVAVNSTRMLGADESIVNANGGAVALGHPIGASGGRIVATLVARAAAGRGRARAGRHLLGRRPGRRAPDRRLTVGCPGPPGSGRIARWPGPGDTTWWCSEGARPAASWRPA